MIDLRLARANPDIFREALARKGAADTFERLLAADRAWADATQRRDEARAEQKRVGKPSSPEQIEGARMLSLLGVILSLSFALVVIASAIPIVILRPCD